MGTTYTVIVQSSFFTIGIENNNGKLSINFNPDGTLAGIYVMNNDINLTKAVNKYGETVKTAVTDKKGIT